MHPSPRGGSPRFDTIDTKPATVLVLGCGAIGSVIAKHLSASDDVERLLLGDIDEDAARRAAREARSPKADALRLNAADPAALARAVRGCGLLVNAVLPRFNVAIRRAAFEVGANYIDLAEESIDPFTDSPAWQDAGLMGILGMGEDPGLSNVLARKAADDLDRVDAVRVRDGDTASSPDHPFIALFSPETFIEETLHTSRIWREGRYEEVPPFGEREVYAFPEPVGPQPVVSVDHEEVDSLPRFLGKGVRYVDFKLAIDPGTERALREYAALVAAGPGADAERARRAFLAKVPKPADLAGRIDGSAALVVEVTGTKDRAPRKHVLHTILGHREAASRYGTTGTAYLTGTPAAAAALLLIRGDLRGPGLLSPEQLDPRPVLGLLRELGIEIQESVTA